MDDAPRSRRKLRRIDRFGERLKNRRGSLSPSLLSVADYIDQHRHAVLGKSALEIAAETGTSDATVIRAIQALGFEGLIDLKDTLEAHIGETDSPSEKMAATTLELSNSVDSAIDFVIADHRNAMEALSSPANREAMTKAISVLLEAKRIGIFGIGASGVLATYAARLFSRNGYPSYALNLTGIALAEQLLTMEKGDALIMMAYGRAHREGMTTITEAERLGIPIVMLLGQEDTVLRKHADASIIIPRAKTEHVALHGPTLVCLESMMLALATAARETTLQSLDRLLTLRGAIRPSKR
ncbi:MurR/RpiR family transcriptional regulator [Rhizobium sophorae]|uniref:MurR/RpiR family transcriptional regulator n=1 Tax=Rhizobium sophorae TaxID=1535242 RepID=A0A7Y3SBC1_9HYPH|nr:MurR/RpiR family transcriptional regulator [Rhizobium sophorae]NKK71126.1 SIS domain-containing protein [Rhizobium leguminosarum bv. viciae]NKL38650.1 SIS domain-containing protein [Rhizobium leguminosarum bv. viciae]NNU40342.1 MurR/RpiR family transcriptional regulator [Rhizobium sophorae]